MNTYTSNEFKKLIKKPKKPTHSESKLQQECVKKFRQHYKPPQYFIFAIPNGGKRGGGKTVNGVPLEAVIMKREGVTAGVSDLFVFSPFNNSSKGLFLECKFDDGKQTDNQKQFENICLQSGYNYAVFKSEYEFFKIIKDFFSKYLKSK